jgi:hypothetical protein
MAGSMSSAPRECGECTLCCKLMTVVDLNKPAGTWCPHCTSRGGCGIYETRPQECRDFVCAWLQSDALDEQWKPSRCKFVVFAEPGSVNLKVSVDPARPDAWRKEPFYSYFKAWVRPRIAQGGKVVVMTGKRATAVLPDRDVDLGECTDDDRVVIFRANTPHGPVFDARKVSADDARVPGAAGG